MLILVLVLISFYVLVVCFVAAADIVALACVVVLLKFMDICVQLQIPHPALNPGYETHFVCSSELGGLAELQALTMFVVTLSEVI